MELLDQIMTGLKTELITIRLNVGFPLLKPLGYSLVLLSYIWLYIISCRVKMETMGRDTKTRNTGVRSVKHSLTI